MSRTPQRLATLASAAVAVAGLAVLAPPAQAASSGVVINEVYGAGGNVGAVYNADFVELANPTGSAISLAGLYIHYRSASGSSGGTPAALSGSIPANGKYLIQMSTTGANGSALPTPDAGPAGFSMAAAGGQVFLLSSSTAITTSGDMKGVAGIVDMVGVSGATSFETAAAANVATTTQSLNRTAADADNNSLEFGLAAPSPTNTGGGPGGGNTFTGTIAEIQGNGAVATKDGFTVTTSGVVTARYAAGGLNGFYMQTAGSGGATDPTPNASDAIFVFTGASGIAAAPAVGHLADVTGLAKEFSGLSEIDATVTGASVADGGATTPIAPRTGALPGTDCALPGTGCLTGTALAAVQEAFEGELWQPSGSFTVTDAYDGSAFGGDAWGTSSSSSFFGEIGLAANSDATLVSPTEVIDAQDHDAVATRTAYNKAHQLVLDDASSITYWNTGGTGQDGLNLPWFTTDSNVRVGSAASFANPMIYTDSFGTRRLLPLEQVTGDGSAQGVAFSDTRPTGVQDVGGDVKLATFNVLNFFPTSAAEYVALNPGTNTCTSFNDRDGNPIAVNTCSPNGPRGAWDATNLARQQAKIVNAINETDADVVSLEELENSVQFGKDRDDAIGKLVAALNADAGSIRWAYVPSPAAADLPALAEQDVIRTGFIYNPATISLVGVSKVLVGDAAFGNAREPLAQAFKIKGTPASSAFGVIVNHFKSKGSGNPDPDGQGNATDSRIAQANSLLAFADQFKTDRSISKLYLVGDFNAYGEEDPVQEIEQGTDNTPGNADDYTPLADTFDPAQASYSFSGLSGSLDHIFANGEALGDVAGVDVFDINAAETVFSQYSRYNYNATILFDPATVYSASDHNPEIVGINGPGSVEIQVLGTNDFHGRIANDATSASAGAAVMAGAVKQLRGQNPNTVFAAAGDLIGASTFESFIDKDKPTIDALNSAGLEVSAAGNHEFDQGYDDLVNRVMAAYDPDTNPQGGADWEYIAANLKLTSTGLDALTPSWTKTMSGVKVGFVGAVTEHLPELVSPAGIADIEVEDIVTSVNQEADQLKADGADIVVMLVHEGAGGTDCAAMDDDPTSDFGSIVTGVDDNVDAIVSGHTHLEYNCSFPVAGWAGRPVTDRPVVSAGQYGAALNQIVFTVDAATGAVQAKSQAVLKLKNGTTGSTFNYPVDDATKTIVDAAVANAAVLGAQPLGQLSAPFARAKFADGTTANRGGESTLGNLVAEVQRWATRNSESGSAQIAFMNPGGLRDDMAGGIAGEAAYPKTLTYKQAANVQPFANTLVNMDLTGAQIKATLEQQWQPAGASRPFLRLGTSEGFTFTYDPSRPAGSRITGMWLDGTPIGLASTYSVTVNSFLASGGDNFTALNGGTSKQDTGKTDLQAMVDYMAEFASSTPLPVSYSQHAVGVKFPTDAPASYFPGATHVVFDLSSLSMTDPNDLRDSAVTVQLGGTTLGTFPVTTSLLPPGDANSNDEAGTASVDVVLPAGTPVGTATLVVSGSTTGTSLTVPVTVANAPVATSVTGSAKNVKFGTAGTVTIKVTPRAAYGTVEVRTQAGVLLGTATITGGKGTFTLAPRVLPVGTHVLTLMFLGNGDFAPSQGSAEVKVTKGK